MTLSPDIIGERTLISAGERRVVVVRIRAPRLSETGADYECAYSITGEGVSVSHYAAGLDSIQAIQLAFIAIGAHLGAIEKEWGSRLTWEGGDTGFPMS